MLLGPFLNTLTHLIHRKVQKASKNLRAIDGLANLFLNVAFFLNWNTLTVCWINNVKKRCFTWVTVESIEINGNIGTGYIKDIRTVNET